MPQENCQSVGHQKDNGRFILRDMLIRRNGKDFIIEVGTSTYLSLRNSFRQQNKVPPIPNENLVYVMSDVSSVEKICEELGQQPDDKLAPYLVPQASHRANSLAS